eukprot:CAMPEP_0179956590 /NCGR_PEP_ID=MMETSP0983-20121128/26972_1 /TAXON_ID=483367 /ORGANISM="non described non described, Strain CCMP 2436" /LENGTH=237 /DNA_ID=CAMNT_0021868451 /DNA_START=1788 /DNA_END=2500 /DNA_ORIENTATION=-
MGGLGGDGGGRGGDGGGDENGGGKGDGGGGGDGLGGGGGRGGVGEGGGRVRFAHVRRHVVVDTPLRTRWSDSRRRAAYTFAQGACERKVSGCVWRSRSKRLTCGRGLYNCAQPSAPYSTTAVRERNSDTSRLIDGKVTQRRHARGICGSNHPSSGGHITPALAPAAAAIARSDRFGGSAKGGSGLGQPRLERSRPPRGGDLRGTGQSRQNCLEMCVGGVSRQCADGAQVSRVRYRSE